MKTSSKILLIIGGGLMTFGFVLLAVGASMGGLRRSSSKLETYVAEAVTMVEDYRYDYDYDYDYDYQYNYRYSDGETTYSWTEYDDVESIDISMDYGEICIMEGSGSSRVTVDAELGKDFSCDVDDGVLTIVDNQNRIKDRDSRNNLYGVLKDGIKDSWAENRYLNIYLPEGMTLDDVKIRLGGGNITVIGIDTGEVKILCGAGEVHVEGNLRDDVTIENGAGSVYVYPSGREKDFNYNLSTGVGSVQIYGEDGSRGGMNFVSGNYNKDNDAGKDMKISCGVGEIDVNYN